jgi:hypothetical protein
LKTEVNVPTGSNKQQKLRKENFNFVVILEAYDEKSRIRVQIRNPVYRSKESEPSQNVPYGSGILLQSDVSDAAKKEDFTYQPENSDPSHTVGAYQQNYFIILST